MGQLISWCVTAVLVTAIVVGGIGYGCTKASENYYDAYKQCIEAKGTWIPTGTSESYKAICIQGAR